LGVTADRSDKWRDPHPTTQRRVTLGDSLGFKASLLEQAAQLWVVQYLEEFSLRLRARPRGGLTGKDTLKQLVWGTAPNNAGHHDIGIQHQIHERAARRTCRTMACTS